VEPLNPTLKEHPWLEEEPDETLRVMVGVDLGQMRDPSAVVVAEAVQRDTGKRETVRRFPRDGDTPPSVWERPIQEAAYLVRHVERLPLRTPYRQVGRRIADIVERLEDLAVLEVDRSEVEFRDPGWREQAPGRRPLKVYVLADATGVGRPVIEEVRLELGTHVPVSAVTITVGERITGGLGSSEVRVPKMILVSRLAALFQRGRIELPETEESRALAEELKAFQVRATTRGIHAEAMSGFHDDLVIALGLATLFDPFLQRVKKGPSIWR
jgi:hypothetical protein